MEIKKGYKMTDVGVIPEDWEVRSIGEMYSFKNGLNKDKDSFGFGTPIINYMDVYKNNGLTSKCIKGKVSLSDYEISYFLVKKGDVFFTRTSETPEEVGIASVLLDELPKGVFSGFLLRARPNGNDIEPLLCKYIFTTESFRSSVIQNSTYTTRALTNGAILSSLYVAFPKSIVEQQAIADALTKVDNLITSLTKVIEKKKLIKKGAMQKLLSGEMRLDGFEGEFATKTFSDFIERFATGLNPRDNFELNKGGNNYYVTIKNFINGKLFLDDNCDKITDEAIDIIDKRSSLKVGDVLFSSIGRIGDAYVINEKPTNWNINESVFSLRPNPAIMDSFFLYYLIKSDSVQKKFDDAISGSTLKSIKLNDLKEIECTYPQNIDEQTAIANVLTTMDNEIEALEKERDKYKCIKQGMMQQLLTGKIRLTCQ